MHAILTITSPTTDPGPFNMFSDVDGYMIAHEIGITHFQLSNGFATSNIPDGTFTLKFVSVNANCNNSIYVDI